MSRRGRKIYLLLDDGPHPECTPPQLDILVPRGFRATFFLVGHLAQRHPGIVQRIDDEGHAIGSHSLTHPRMPRMSARAQFGDIDAAEGVLQRFDGRRQPLFRTLIGCATVVSILDCVLRRRPVVLWTGESKDSELCAKQEGARMAWAAPRSGDIRVLHDDRRAAGAPLTHFLSFWQESGLSFAAL